MPPNHLCYSRMLDTDRPNCAVGEEGETHRSPRTAQTFVGHSRAMRDVAELPALRDCQLFFLSWLVGGFGMEMLLWTNFCLQRVLLGKNRAVVFIFQRSRWRSLVGHNVSLTPIRSPVQVRALVRTPFFTFFARASLELSFCSALLRALPLRRAGARELP